MNTLNFETEQGRFNAILDLESECKKAFIDAGFEIAKTADFDLDLTTLRISLGVIEEKTVWSIPAFRSDITMETRMINKSDSIILKICEHAGSTEDYIPEHKNLYWRTIHAASILKNWDKACELFNIYTTKFKELDKVLSVYTEKERQRNKKTMDNEQLEKDKSDLKRLRQELDKKHDEVNRMERAVELGRCKKCNEPLMYGEKEYCGDYPNCEPIN